MAKEAPENKGQAMAFLTYRSENGPEFEYLYKIITTHDDYLGLIRAMARAAYAYSLTDAGSRLMDDTEGSMSIDQVYQNIPRDFTRAYGFRIMERTEIPNLWGADLIKIAVKRE